MLLNWCLQGSGEAITGQLLVDCWAIFEGSGSVLSGVACGGGFGGAAGVPWGCGPWWWWLPGLGVVCPLHHTVLQLLRCLR